jgi:hypothetical protein
MVPLRVIAPATAIILGSVVSAMPARSLPASAAPSLGFETPSIVDPIHTNGEPDIAIDPQGRVFVSGPTGTGTQRSTWFGSVDGGHTYRVMAQKNPPDPAISTLAPAPGGGDTDINFDRSGKQYFTDLYALACLRMAVTGPVNSGAADQEAVFPGGCAAIPGADRQWLAVYDPAPGTPNQSAYKAAGGKTPLIYLEYNNIVGPGPNGGAQWNKSTDGLTYDNATAGEVPPGTGAAYSPFGADGYPAIDQVSGKVFQAAGCTTANGCKSSGLWLNIGTPDKDGILHFLDDAGGGTQDLKRLIKIADTPSSPDTLFSVVSMDSARNLFVAYALSAPTTNPGQRQVFVSVASPANNWSTWTAPVQVSDGSISTGDAVNVFPWIKAGGPGRADAVWYGSDKRVDPSSHNNQVWNVFMSQVVFPTGSNGAVTGVAPITTLVKVTPHPMHYDDVCLMGTGCIASQGNRNLADFFAVTIDQTGAAEIVYDDTSNGLVQGNQCTVQVADHCGAGVITVARQSSGLGLFGRPVSGPSNAPASGLSDRAGDALFPVIGGTNQRGMDVRSSSLQLSSDGQTLNVTMQVVDLANPALTAAAITGSTNLQYVTRWQMGNTIYYAAMENTPVNQPSFYAGAAQSIDLCSVSACFPHVITYPEPPPAGNPPATFTGKAETGAIICPASPSADNPCSLTVRVKVADIGSPTANSLLEEVGGYAFAAAIQEGAETNLTAESDTVPLEIDGVCCYNFKASVANTFPPPCHEGDGEGDVSDGHHGSAHMRFDADGCKDGDVESVQESDSNTGDNFQSNRITAVTFNDALSKVTILGTGTHNGSPATFALVAVNGAAGVGAFSLTLSDGYAVSGTLLNGSIQLQ